MTNQTSCGDNTSTLELKGFTSFSSAAIGRCRQTSLSDNNIYYWILRLARVRLSIGGVKFGLFETLSLHKPKACAPTSQA